jgi:hypothetical protein
MRIKLGRVRDKSVKIKRRRYLDRSALAESENRTAILTSCTSGFSLGIGVDFVDAGGLTIPDGRLWSIPKMVDVYLAYNSRYEITGRFA